MKGKLLIKAALILGLVGSAAAQSANPQPTPKPTPGRDSDTLKQDPGPGRPASRSARPVVKPGTNRRTPAASVKPPTAGENPAPLNPTAPASVTPPTASEAATPLNGTPSPAVKPPTATKDPTPVKANRRPAAALAPEPFTNATVEQMAGQCVNLETEAGLIEFEVYPEHAPETVRAFLNLTASGALDTTTFSRIVKGFVIQGGSLETSARWSYQLAARAGRAIPDEPNQLKHERGVVSMARSDKPNSATTNFFILVGNGSHLDGTFAAFGRVRRGMDVADKINEAPVVEEKPDKPVKINQARVAPCRALP